MNITFYCTYCGQQNVADASVAGTQVTCTACGRQFIAPEPSGTETRPQSQVQAQAQTSQPRESAVAKPSYMARNVAGGIVLVIIIGSLALFHIVQTENGFAFVPKEHLTFSMTFTSIQEVLERWNNRSLGDAMRGDKLLEHLVRELEQRGHISSRKTTGSVSDSGGHVSRQITEAIDTIFDEYAANTVRANERFKGNVLSVNGVVIQIFDFMVNINVDSVRQGRICTVGCIVRQNRGAVQNLELNQRVTVTGTVMGGTYVNVFGPELVISLDNWTLRN